MIDTDELAAPGTFRRWAWDFLSSPRTLRGHFGRRMVGLFSLTSDVFAEGLSQTVTMPWVHGNPPPDMLGPLGRDLNLPRYPTETNAQYQARLQRGWDDWELAGANSAIIGQLAAAGFPGAQIARTGVFQFDVFYPSGSHSVGAAPKWGTFQWGDGTKFGPTNITAAEIETMRGIIRKWKPGRWVCRRLIWQLSGWAYGTGHKWGDPGLTWGGTQVWIGV